MAGETDVSALLAALEPEQLAEWEALDSIMPIGIDRICHVLALIGAKICAQLTPGVAFCPADFLPWRERSEQSPEMQIAIAGQIAAKG